jgi:hypothetical protein
MSHLNTFLKVLQKIGYPNPSVPTYAKITDYDLDEVVEDYDTSKDLLEPIADKPWIESWKVGELVLF